MDIKVSFKGNEYETDSPFMVFAWLIAVGNFDIESGLAQEVAGLCLMLYLDVSDLSAVELIDYVCENYDDLPDDYKDIETQLKNDLLGAW